jgi:trans-aconitate 2-methyltransferase
MSWSASQYMKFEDERSRPVRDLLANIPTANVTSAIDIGCGPGNSTELLYAKYPDAAVSGMDSSADMIKAACKRLPDLKFEAGDISDWQNPGLFDVILSNAALQWVPDHAKLLPTLMKKLTPAGSLAVQMPDNLEEPAHILMREIANDGPWASKISQPANSSTSRLGGGTDWYYRTLRESVAKVDVWRTIYHHPLSGGAAAVVEWFKGSALRPYLDQLSNGEREEYLLRYQAAIAQAYPPLPDGSVLLPFPRLFFVATR